MLGNDVQRKWSNLRSSFRRELRLQRETSSGQALKKRKKYIYFEKLLFLLPSVENRETSGNVDSDEDSVDVEDESFLEPANAESTPVTSRRPPQTRKKNTFEESLIQILQKKAHAEGGKESDEDLNFALSLVPTLRSLDSFQKMEAKIQIMNVLKQIRFPQGNPQIPRATDLNVRMPYEPERFSSTPLFPNLYPYHFGPSTSTNSSFQ